MTKITLRNYENAVEALAQEFAKKYYESDCYFYWIGDEIGGTLVINDEFWNLDRIVEAIRLKPTSDQLFDFYNYELECYSRSKKVGINFGSFLKMFGNVEKYIEYEDARKNGSIQK